MTYTWELADIGVVGVMGEYGVTFSHSSLDTGGLVSVVEGGWQDAFLWGQRVVGAQPGVEFEVVRLVGGVWRVADGRGGRSLSLDGLRRSRGWV